MSYHAIDIPIFEKEINDTPFFTTVTLDEYGNIYLVNLDTSISLWIYRFESSSLSNAWERRDWPIFMTLLFVRKNRIYGLYRRGLFNSHFASMNLDDGNYFEPAIIKTNYRYFRFYEIWENEIRFYRYELRCHSCYDLTGYDVFCLNDYLWKEGDADLSEFNVVLNIPSDKNVCLRGDVLYVRGERGIKKYFRDGTWRWIYINPSPRENFFTRSMLSEEFFQVGCFFCFLESATLVLVSLEGIVVRKTPCPFDTQYKIECTLNGIYILSYSRKEQLKMTRFYPECLSLKEITFEQVTKDLKNYSQSELRLKIGNLAERFIEMRC
jgi:hypothetical protein